MSSARSFPLVPCKRRISSPSSRGPYASPSRARPGRCAYPLLLPCSAFVLASVLPTLLAVEPLESLIELRNVFEALALYLFVYPVTTAAPASILGRVRLPTSTPIP